MKRAFVVVVAGLAAAFAAAQAPSPSAPAAAATAPAAVGAKTWIGRYAEFEDYLRQAPIERQAELPVGVTKSDRVFFAPGGLAASATAKHLPMGRRGGFWEAHNSEIAAYELDRVLGLDMVPPTVERRVGPDLGSVQLWVEGCRVIKDVDQSACPKPTEWAKQVLPAEGLRQPDREHRPERRQHPGGRRVEHRADRPLARLRERHHALREADDPRSTGPSSRS